MKGPESLPSWNLPSRGKVKTKQIACHKENIFIKTAHWEFAQNIFSFSGLRQGIDAKKILGSLVYTTPSNKPLNFVNPVIFTGKPTKYQLPRHIFKRLIL